MRLLFTIGWLGWATLCCGTAAAQSGVDPGAREGAYGLPLASGLRTDDPGEASTRPPPLHIEYATYSVAVSADVLADPGGTCADPELPCILGGGGGIVLRGGWQSAGPWYLGGAYQFSKTDSDNLYRLPILQQLRAEARYTLDMGSRARPYAVVGAGGVIYGNEWGAETGGGTVGGGFGAEIEVSRLALMGAAATYQPILFAAFTDTADFRRDPGVAHYVRFEIQFQLRSEISRF